MGRGRWAEPLMALVPIALAVFTLVVLVEPGVQPAIVNLRLALAIDAVATLAAVAVAILGWVRYRRSEYPLAITALEAAKKAAPARADIAGHLGLAYAKAGRKPAAAAELKRALEHPEQVTPLADVKQALAQLSGPAK